MPSSTGTLTRWLAASGVVAGIVVGIGVGLNPGSGPMSLSAPWQRHAFVAGVSGAGNPDGADGLYLADFNGDGDLDAVVGHEQGLRVTLSLNPGPAGNLVEGEWPTVILPTVNMCSVEDAIACDVDADGSLDIVAACETGTVRVEIMFAPSPATDAALLNPANWTRVTLDDSATRRSMRAACADLAGDSALEIIVGEKDAGVASTVGYYSSATPRTGSSWAHTAIVPVGWVMQMYVIDFDGDLDLDIVYSDREGINTPTPDLTNRGVRWLDSDGADPPVFTERTISAVEGQWKWFDLADWDGDTDLDVIGCRSEPPSVHEQAIFINGGGGTSWSEVAVLVPTGVGFCQHATAADVDDDGDLDLAVSYFDATNARSLVWQMRAGAALTPTFKTGNISGIIDADSDVKLDNLVWFDIDEDGDVDAMSTEQHVASGTGPGLGGVYWENPLIQFLAPPAPVTVTCSLLTSGSNTTDATAIATAAVTPGANRPVYAAILTTSSVANQRAPTSVTGAGVTFALVDDEVFTTVSTYRRLTVYEGVAASPTTEAVTFDYGAGGNLSSWAWAIVECAGGDPADPSAQIDVAAVAAGTSAPTALAALASADSAHLCIVGQSVNSATAVTPDADFVELQENAVANGSGSIAVGWANDQTDCTATWASADAAQLSIEVATP